MKSLHGHQDKAISQSQQRQAAKQLADLVTKTSPLQQTLPGWVAWHHRSSGDLLLALQAKHAHVHSLQPGHPASLASSNLFYTPTSLGNRQRRPEAQRSPVPSSCLGFSSLSRPNWFSSFLSSSESTHRHAVFQHWSHATWQWNSTVSRAPPIFLIKGAISQG